MSEAKTTRRDHALVLGGSMAGLFTATVLSKYFQRVTIIERDPVHDEPESRKGQPHTRHLHGLLETTYRFLEHHLPGVIQGLIDGGAMVGDFGESVRWYHFDDYKIEAPIGIQGMTVSRPFLEWHVRRYVTSLPNVTLLDETAAEELVTDANRSRITGVKVTRRAENAVSETIEADLIIDASGRGSASPKWLAQLGYDAPQEEAVNVRFGYATRLYKRDPNMEDLKVLMIAPTPPKGKSGAFMFPIEGDRWILTAGGWFGGHPPADEAGFMEFIRNLPTSDIYDIICHAEPLSDITLYKYPYSRRLRYDRLRRFPEGYLVVGDAVASFNPIYGQGMSSAALQIETLDQMLKQGDISGKWRTFFRRTARLIDMPWLIAGGEDYRYPETEGKRPLGTNFINWYIAFVHRATQRDPVVYNQFLKVMHLLAIPYSLAYPRIMWRVMRTTVADWLRPKNIKVKAVRQSS